MASFQQNQHQAYIDMLNKYKKLLPPFTDAYLTSLATKEIRTQAQYCYEVARFLTYTVERPAAANVDSGSAVQSVPTDSVQKSTTNITIDDLARMNHQDINRYLAFLINEHGYTSASVKKILTALNSFFTYLEISEQISSNPVRMAMKPGNKDKLDIIHLERAEMDELCQIVANDPNMTEHRKPYYTKTCLRDLAIITMLLFSGIRVSECAGIDLTDVDLKNHEFKVSRKGYNKKSKQQITMHNDVFLTLKNYMEVREKMTPVAGDENALFLSLQNKRMGIRSIEKMVKKYAIDLSPSKDNITPHKLRASFATALYAKTHDIYLVAAALNHVSVETTVRHYTSINSERRKEAYTTL